MARGGAVAARRAHNPKVAGSNPAPATNIFETLEAPVDKAGALQLADSVG